MNNLRYYVSFKYYSWWTLNNWTMTQIIIIICNCHNWSVPNTRKQRSAEKAFKLSTKSDRNKKLCTFTRYTAPVRERLKCFPFSLSSHKLFSHKRNSITCVSCFFFRFHVIVTVWWWWLVSRIGHTPYIIFFVGKIYQRAIERRIQFAHFYICEITFISFINFNIVYSSYRTICMSYRIWLRSV